jgi:hypothetical protein
MATWTPSRHRGTGPAAGRPHGWPAGPRAGSDALADASEATELLAVDVDQLAGMRTLVAADRLGGRERQDAAAAEPLAAAADRGRCDAEFGGDLLAGPALAAPGRDLLDAGRRRRYKRCGREERSCSPARSSAAKRATPLRTVRGQTPVARATASSVCPLDISITTRSRPNGVRRAFLWMFRPALRGIAEASQLRLPRPAPDGRPVASSQLERFSIKRNRFGIHNVRLL